MHPAARERFPQAGEGGFDTVSLNDRSPSVMVWDAPGFAQLISRS